MKFTDVVAIVTGGAAGFGRAFAERILKGGGKVLITDVNVEQLEITAKELAAKFGKSKITWTHQDVVDSDSFHRVFDHASAFFKQHVNVLVNNAGVPGSLTFYKEGTPGAWESVMNIDLIALMRGAQVAIQEFKKNLKGKEGVIVNVASTTGLYAVALSPEYVAAKHGVVGFTRSCYPLKKETNIRVVALAPSFAKTAIGKLAEKVIPDQVADMGGIMEVSKVVDAFELAVTDETNPGRIILVVPGGHSYYHFAGDKQLHPNAKL